MRWLNRDQQVWDEQFAAGIWGQRERSPEVVKLIKRLLRENHDVLEFGCGTGNLPAALENGSFRSYTGYDISGEAIRRAADRGLEGCRFAVKDMRTWRARDARRYYDLILAEEVVYYLGRKDLCAFLRQCRLALTPVTGILLVIIHDKVKHAGTVRTCCEVMKVFHEIDIKGRLFLLLKS